MNNKYYIHALEQVKKASHILYYCGETFSTIILAQGDYVP